MGQVTQIELVEPCFLYDHMSEGRHSYQHPFTSYLGIPTGYLVPGFGLPRWGSGKMLYGMILGILLMELLRLFWNPEKTILWELTFAVEVNACQVLLHKLDSSQDNVVQKVDTQKVAVDNLLNSITGAIWSICLIKLFIFVGFRTIYIYIENNQKIYIYWGLNMCPVMRGFEEIGCFFYKGLLKGLGWGRENWRSLGTWNRRENFEVTSQVLFFHFAIKHGWNIHSVQWFSLSNSMEKLWGFPKKPPLPQKKPCVVVICCYYRHFLLTIITWRPLDVFNGFTMVSPWNAGSRCHGQHQAGLDGHGELL